MKCPYCGRDDSLYEVGTMTVMYSIESMDEDGNINYDDREDLDGTYEMNSPFPYYCQYCDKDFGYSDGVYITDEGDIK